MHQEDGFMRAWMLMRKESASDAQGLLLFPVNFGFNYYIYSKIVCKCMSHSLS